MQVSNKNDERWVEPIKVIDILILDLFVISIDVMNTPPGSWVS